MEAPETSLKRRTYNVNAISFTPKQLVSAIEKYVPKIVVTFKPDRRQQIGKRVVSFVYTLSFVYAFQRTVGLKSSMIVMHEQIGNGVIHMT